MLTFALCFFFFLSVRFGEDAVQRMVDFIDVAREEEIFSEMPTVLDLGENVRRVNVSPTFRRLTPLCS